MNVSCLFRVTSAWNFPCETRSVPNSLKFQETEDDEDEGNPEGKIVYTSSDKSSDDKDDDNNGIDPRWDILKKLK